MVDVKRPPRHWKWVIWELYLVAGVCLSHSQGCWKLESARINKSLMDSDLKLNLKTATKSYCFPYKYVVLRKSDNYVLSWKTSVLPGQMFMWNGQLSWKFEMSPAISQIFQVSKSKGIETVSFSHWWEDFSPSLLKVLNFLMGTTVSQGHHWIKIIFFPVGPQMDHVTKWFLD